MPQNHVTKNVYKSKKLGSYFNTKDSLKLEHQHDLDHAEKDRKSNMVKHSTDIGHPPVYMKDFQILTKGFNHCKFKRKICETLLIKKHQPKLNAQEHSIMLEIFN